MLNTWGELIREFAIGALTLLFGAVVAWLLCAL
jgi:hypothetical protein